MKRTDQVSRRLRLKDLHTLQAVAELGSMAKASQQLALSQPAISKALGEMERTVGTALLDRSSRGVELTESGRLLLGRARNIFDEVRQGIEDIAAASDPTQGEIRIGAAETLTVVLSEIVGHLVRKYPRLRYSITISDGDSLNRDLRERKLDVVFRRWLPTLDADDLRVEVAFKQALGVLAERRHPLLRRKKLQLADLMEEQWALSPADSFLGRVVADLFARRNLPLPSAVVRTVSVYMRMSLLASGKFISVLPLTMLQHGRGWLRPLNVDLSDSAAPIALVTLAKRQPSGALKLFRQASLEVCKKFAPAS